MVPLTVPGPADAKQVSRGLPGGGSCSWQQGGSWSGGEWVCYVRPQLPRDSEESQPLPSHGVLPGSEGWAVVGADGLATRKFNDGLSQPPSYSPVGIGAMARGCGRPVACSMWACCQGGP